MVTLKTLQLFENEEIMFKILARTPKIFEKIAALIFVDYEKSNVGNRLKQVWAKFEPDGSHPGTVNGRLNFSRFERRTSRQKTFRGHAPLPNPFDGYKINTPTSTSTSTSMWAHV